MSAEPQPDPLVVLAGRVAELVDPIRVERRREFYHRRRHRTVVAFDVWVFPSLLDQLRAAGVPGLRAAEGGARRAPGSRLLVDAGAVDVLARIEAGVSMWVYALNMDRRGSPEAELRALVGAAAGVDRVTLGALAGDVDGWWRRARAYARFDS